MKTPFLFSLLCVRVCVRQMLIPHRSLLIFSLSTVERQRTEEEEEEEERCSLCRARVCFTEARSVVVVVLLMFVGPSFLSLRFRLPVAMSTKRKHKNRNFPR